MYTSRSLSVLVLLATLLAPLHALASSIDPPAFLPEPAWVNMVEQHGADARLAGFLTPQGVKLEIVAEHPLLADAGQICFAPDGSLWLLEWRPGALASAKESSESLTYRDGTNRSVRRMSTPVKDVIKRISNPNVPAAFDQAKVVLEAGLLSCMMVQGEWLYIASSGTVRRYRQSRSDGPYDVEAVVARGFGGTAPRPAFGLAVDFDGSLLITVGPGTHDVEGSDGSRASVEGSGAVFRCRADGSRLEVLALGLGDPKGGAVFDRNFQPFQLDVSMGAAQASRRLLHLAEGSDFGFRGAPGSHPFTDDGLRKHCLRGLAGVMKPILSRTREASGGLCLYADSAFPPFVQGLLLCPDPARGAILALKPERRDSSFAITEQFDLVRNEDRHFVLTQVLVGPDGAIYFCEKPAPGDSPAPSAKKREGRLYRLSWVGGPAHPALPLRDPSSWSRIKSLGGGDLVKRLAAADASDSQIAQQELMRRGPLNKAALIQALSNREFATEARILAAGALCVGWDAEVKSALIKLATDDDAVLRRIAAECLGRRGAERDPQIREVLLQVLGEPDPASRRSVALAIARVAAPDAADCLATALSFDIGGDLYLRDGLLRALERLGKPGVERLLALANSGEDDRLELAIESFSALRSPAALAVLPQLLGQPHLRGDQRGRLVRSLARYDRVRGADFLPVARTLGERPPHEIEVWSAWLEVGAVRCLGSPGGFVPLFFRLGL